MELLLLGDLEVLTESICTALAAEHRVVLYGNADKKLTKLRGIRHYLSEEDDPQKRKEQRLEKLFRTYSFDAVVLLSPAMVKKPDWASENAWLHTVFDLCRANKVSHAVYITLDVMRLETREPGAYEDYEILLRNDTERLTWFYAQSLNLTVLRVPYIYDPNEVKYPLKTVMQIAHHSNRIDFAYSPDTRIDFVSMRDLTSLLLRVLDSSPGGEYTVRAQEGVTVRSLQQSLQKVKPELQVRYYVEDVGLRAPRLQQKPDDGPRRDFGWFAKDNILDELPQIYQNYKPDPSELPPTFSQRLHGIYAAQLAKPWLKFLSVTVLFGGFVALHFFGAASAEFAFLDFYLLFVTLVGTVYGLNCGIYAAVLVCAAALVERVWGGTDFQILFYNMENWMPFVFYLMLGAVLGYLRDSRDAKARYTRQERAVIEDKYLFVKTAYEDMLITKQELKKQVLGAHQSFGRIYDITRRLDKHLPSEIMSETLKAIETTLENHTIAIYAIDRTSDYGRLTVCSGEIGRSVRKSIDLAKYEAIMDTLEDGYVWCNTAALTGYPDCCASIYEDNEPVYLVFVNEIPFNRMNTYFVNQVKVLCGLCQGAFLRSLKEERGEHIKRCVPETELLRPEWFAKLIETNKALKEEHASEYIVCRTILPPDTPKRLDKLVAPLMRATDTAGLDANGVLYILFTQATRDDFAAIQARYRQGGIPLEVVEDGDFAS